MREAIHNLEASKIREVANAGLGRDDVLAFWFGESDEVTPEVIRQAAIDSLQRGETFYAHNLGLPELREAIARYTSALHPAVDASRIAVTSGGVSALMLAVQALVDAGDEVVAVTPVWPNLTAQPAILGAQVRTVPLVPADGQWTLDLAALRKAVTPKTRLLIVNAPNNPTGWTMTREEQQAVLDHCRETGTWILADEVYERLYFEPTPNSCAPSFLDISRPDDRLVVTHSFSKSFLMTGWRLGWLVLSPALVDGIGKLIEFNTSCASVFTQRAAIAAIDHTAEITPPAWWPTSSSAATPWCPFWPRCPAFRWPPPRAACTPSSASKASATPSTSPSAWSSKPASAWPPAMPSPPKPRAGCAGASPPRTRSGWSRAWSA